MINVKAKGGVRIRFRVQKTAISLVSHVHFTKIIVTFLTVNCISREFNAFLNPLGYFYVIETNLTMKVQHSKTFPKALFPVSKKNYIHALLDLIQQKTRTAITIK